MAEHQVDSIFVRKITPGDFVNIERATNAGAGTGSGSGQLYIDVPVRGELPLPRLWGFLGVPSGDRDDTTTWPETTIEVATIGEPAVSAPLEFLLRRGGNARYRIANQNRQAPGGNRHPAWTGGRGFPEAPNDIGDKTDPRLPDIAHLKVYIVKTVEGRYFAGFINSAAIPDEWPHGVGLESLFTAGTQVVDYSRPRVPEAPELVNRILDAWRHSPNVLLYGPPGTGKTYAMQFAWDLIRGDAPLEAVHLDDESTDTPFLVRGIALPFQRPARREWATFHQNYSYENFILALRPEPIPGGGFTLKPRLGTLLDAAVSVDPAVAQADDLQARSAIIFVDEVNRGNVSRIFGEFITFMDRDYRAGPGTTPLPVPLTAVRAQDAGLSEPIARERGADVRLPLPWHFPQSVFMLASMNSVDRAVAPLDTALARRFARIEVGPDLDQLASWLGLAEWGNLLPNDTASTAAEAPPVEEAPAAEDEAEEAAAPGHSAASTAFLLLYRLNFYLAALLGPDFELGHAYLRPVASALETGEEEAYTALARAWDQALYPQLRERLANRPDELMRVLRLDRTGGPARYLIRLRPQALGVTKGMAAPRSPIEVPSFEAAASHRYADMEFSLKYLAGIEA
jgi:hypothetical protein